MAVISINPDNRPLPVGWTSFFDNEKGVWYYMNISVVPPQISYIHPGDFAPAFAPPPQTPSSASSASTSHPPMGGNISLAQQLYASSVSGARNPSSYNQPSTLSNSAFLGRMSPGHTSPNQSFDGASLYTSSRSISTSPTVLHSTGPSSLQSSPSFSSFSGAPSLSPLSPQTNHPGSQRTHSYQVPGTVLPVIPQSQQRAATLSAGTSAQRLYSSQSTGTPSITMIARPPSQLNQNMIGTMGLSTANTNQSGFVQSTLFPPGYGMASPSYVSPTNSQFSVASVQSPVSFSSNAGQPPPPPPKELWDTSAMSRKTKEGAQRTVKVLKQLGEAGKVAGKAALKVAGGAVSLAAGMPPQTLANVGSAIAGSVMRSELASEFMQCFSEIPPELGVGAQDVQAVLQGQPNANYQAIINGLLIQQQKQQQLQIQQQLQAPSLFGVPATPTVNYQALISEIQRIQNVAAAAQKAAANLQVLNSLQQSQAGLVTNTRPNPQLQALLNGMVAQQQLNAAQQSTAVQNAMQTPPPQQTAQTTQQLQATQITQAAQQQQEQLKLFQNIQNSIQEYQKHQATLNGTNSAQQQALNPVLQASQQQQVTLNGQNATQQHTPQSLNLADLRAVLQQQHQVALNGQNVNPQRALVKPVTLQGHQQQVTPNGQHAFQQQAPQPLKPINLQGLQHQLLSQSGQNATQVQQEMQPLNPMPQPQHQVVQNGLNVAQSQQLPSLLNGVSQVVQNTAQSTQQQPQVLNGSGTTQPQLSPQPFHSPPPSQQQVDHGGSNNTQLQQTPQSPVPMAQGPLQVTQGENIASQQQQPLYPMPEPQTPNTNQLGPAPPYTIAPQAVQQQGVHPVADTPYSVPPSVSPPTQGNQSGTQTPLQQQQPQPQAQNASQVPQQQSTAQSPPPPPQHQAPQNVAQEQQTQAEVYMQSAMQAYQQQQQAAQNEQARQDAIHSEQAQAQLDIQNLLQIYQQQQQQAAQNAIQQQAQAQLDMQNAQAYQQQLQAQQDAQSAIQAYQQQQQQQQEQLVLQQQQAQLEALQQQQAQLAVQQQQQDMQNSLAAYEQQQATQNTLQQIQQDMQTLATFQQLSQLQQDSASPLSAYAGEQQIMLDAQAQESQSTGLSDFFSNLGLGDGQSTSTSMFGDVLNTISQQVSQISVDSGSGYNIDNSTYEYTAESSSEVY